MNDKQKELAQAWIAALRSKKYKPVHGVLRAMIYSDDDEKYVPAGYCCLGVACDVYKPQNWKGEYYGRSREASILPVSVAEAYGMKSKTGTYDYSKLPPKIQARLRRILGVSAEYFDGHDNLVNINDDSYHNSKNPFPLIADILEYAMDHPEVGIFK